MDTLINNPGFNNITKKIFLLLDHETLLTCRLVCKSFKTKVEDPYCWIKICSQLGQPKSLTDLWTGRILNGCQKGLQNITSSYGHHKKNIEFITSGRRPRVINLIFSSDDHNYE